MYSCPLLVQASPVNHHAPNHRIAWLVQQHLHSWAQLSDISNLQTVNTPSVGTMRGKSTMIYSLPEGHISTFRKLKVKDGRTSWWSTTYSKLGIGQARARGQSEIGLKCHTDHHTMYSGWELHLAIILFTNCTLYSTHILHRGCGMHYCQETKSKVCKNIYMHPLATNSSCSYPWSMFWFSLCFVLINALPWHIITILLWYHNYYFLQWMEKLKSQCKLFWY